MDRETCAYFREKHGLERLEPIEKGWSSDVKYKAADKDGKLCLLRITPPGKDANRREMFELTQRTASLGVPMCARLRHVRRGHLQPIRVDRRRGA